MEQGLYLSIYIEFRETILNIAELIERGCICVLTHAKLKLTVVCLIIYYTFRTMHSPKFGFS